MSLKHVAILGLLVFALGYALLAPVPVYSETIPVTEDSWTSLVKALSFVQGQGKVENFAFSYTAPGGYNGDTLNTVKIQCDSLTVEEHLVKDGDLTTVDYSIDVRGLKVEVTGSSNINLDLDAYTLSSTFKIRYTDDGLTLSAYAPMWRLMLSRLG